MSESKFKVSNINILRKIAEQSGCIIHIDEKTYHHSATHPEGHHKREVYMKLDTETNATFACYENSTDFGGHANYSGVFIPVKVPLNARLKIRNRDILDKTNPFLNESKTKSGITEFDRNVVIEDSDFYATKLIVESKNFQASLLQTFKHNQILCFGLNDISLDFIPKFHNKSSIGFYIINDWIIDKDEIEFLFFKIIEIKRILNL